MAAEGLLTGLLTGIAGMAAEGLLTWLLTGITGMAAEGLLTGLPRDRLQFRREGTDQLITGPE